MIDIKQNIYTSLLVGGHVVSFSMEFNGERYEFNEIFSIYDFPTKQSIPDGRIELSRKSAEHSFCKIIQNES